MSQCPIIEGTCPSEDTTSAGCCMRKTYFHAGRIVTGPIGRKVHTHHQCTEYKTGLEGGAGVWFGVWKMATCKW